MRPIPQKDKDKIINKAVKKTNKEQRELVNKYMKTTKEKLIEEFENEFIKDLGDEVEPIFVDPNGSVGPIKYFLSQAIDQTREETIRETLKEIRGYIKDNEKIGYENRVLAADEIYAKLSIMYDKSLINK